MTPAPKPSRRALAPDVRPFSARLFDAWIVDRYGYRGRGKAARELGVCDRTTIAALASGRWQPTLELYVRLVVAAGEQLGAWLEPEVLEATQGAA